MILDNEITISIVIPTKNAEGTLRILLSSIFKQKIDEFFEVICIDSGSKDKTLEICEKFLVKIIKINPEEFNHGLTRNFGIGQAQGKYVILLTQDAIPYDEYWMKNMIRSIKSDDRIAGVYCRQIARYDADILTKEEVENFLTGRKRKAVSFIDDSTGYSAMSPKKRYEFCNFDNVCSCINKDIWQKIPFPKTEFAEDLEWSKAVLEAGYKIVYEPETIVMHSHKKSLKYEYARNYVNYKRLYELFNLDYCPTFIHAAILFLKHSFKGALYILKNIKRIDEIILLFKTPFYYLCRVGGQYKGVRDQKLNINKR